MITGTRARHDLFGAAEQRSQEETHDVLLELAVKLRLTADLCGPKWQRSVGSKLILSMHTTRAATNKSLFHSVA